MVEQVTLNGSKYQEMKKCKCCKKIVNCISLLVLPEDLTEGYCCLCYAKEGTEVPRKLWLKHQLLCEECVKRYEKGEDN